MLHSTAGIRVGAPHCSTASTLELDCARPEQAAVNELFAGKQVTMWLTERCEINASDAKLYADALAQLGVDRPADLQMIDGDEVAWPSAVKLLDREKIQRQVSSSRKMPRGSLISDTI